MKRIFGHQDGAKVKMNNIVGTPIGFITFGELLYPNAGSMNAYFGSCKYWVRLDNGILLKDVLPSEFSVVKR